MDYHIVTWSKWILHWRRQNFLIVITILKINGKLTLVISKNIKNTFFEIFVKHGYNILKLLDKRLSEKKLSLKYKCIYNMAFQKNAFFNKWSVFHKNEYGGSVFVAVGGNIVCNYGEIVKCCRKFPRVTVVRVFDHVLCHLENFPFLLPQETFGNNKKEHPLGLHKISVTLSLNSIVDFDLMEIKWLVSIWNPTMGSFK